MSLKVWLPLNGNTKNIGTSNITLTGSPNAWNSGKFNKCAYWNGSTSNVVYNNTTAFNYTDNFSVAFWANPVYTGTTAQFAWTVGRADAGGYGYGFQIANASTANFRFGNGTYSVSAPNNEWHHYAMTVGNNKVTIYKDGVQVSSNNLPGTLPTYSDGNGMGLGCFHYSGNIYPYYGSMNDFRIYDHCLSTSEIKEIARGLVCHYPLDNSEVVTNLAINSNTDNASTNTWYMSYQTGDTARVIEYDDNRIPCLKITKGSTEASGWSYLHFDNINRSAIKTNTTYTISFDVKTSVNGTIGFSAIMQGNATNSLSASVTTISNTTTANQWCHCQYTTLTKSSFDGITISSQCLYMSISASLKAVGVTMSFKNVMFIEGSSDHTWVPSPTDAKAYPLGITSTIVPDASGLGNNGTIVGTLTYINDSPRNGYSTKFSDGAYIRHKMPENMYYATYSFWVKGSYTNYGAIYIQEANPSGGASPWLALNTESVKVWAYFGGNSPSYTKGASGTLDSNWHHCVYVWNNGVAQWYLDGATCGNAVTYTGKTYIANTSNSTIGDSYTGSSWSGTPFTGQLSDFRIYATALSATDIKNLYEASQKIDNKDVIHSFDYNEQSTISLAKNTTTVGSLSEFTALQGLKYDTKTYIEPDGSAWVRIFHHSNPASKLFASGNTFANSVYIDADRWFNFQVCNDVSTWEFMIKQKAESTTATESKYRWIQTKNPMTAVFADVAAANITKVTTSGYTSFSHGGLYKIQSNTYLCTNNGTNGNWWGAVGAWTNHQSGIPAWAGVIVKTGYEDVYLRIDNLTDATPVNAQFKKSGIMTASNFIEM